MGTASDAFAAGVKPTGGQANVAFGCWESVLPPVGAELKLGPGAERAQLAPKAHPPPAEKLRPYGSGPTTSHSGPRPGHAPVV
jgi:hypothetical protein